MTDNAVAYVPDQQAVANFLHTVIQNVLSDNVGKVTGMLLEKGEQEIKEMLRSRQELHKLLVEALSVLEFHDVLRHPIMQDQPKPCTIEQYLCWQQIIASTESTATMDAPHAALRASSTSMVVSTQQQQRHSQEDGPALSAMGKVLLACHACMCV